MFNRAREHDSRLAVYNRKSNKTETGLSINYSSKKYCILQTEE